MPFSAVAISKDAGVTDELSEAIHEFFLFDARSGQGYTYNSWGEAQFRRRGYITRSGACQSLSDKRAKSDIQYLQPEEKHLTNLVDFPVATFTMIGEEQTQIGVIA